MKIRIKSIPSRERRSALTLLEILVSMSILIIIVFGLMAMFNQTQKIFRTSLTNVDVLEGGRSAMDMISRDLEQMTTGNDPTVTNLFVATNSFGTFTPLILPISGNQRTNSLQQVYFLAHPDQWQGLGFRVLDTNSTLPDSILIGTLYKFSTNSVRLGAGPRDFIYTYTTSPVSLITNRTLNRIIDGVIHFNMKFYDTNGFQIYKTTFSGKEAPAYIELELGILEPQILEQIKSMNAPGAANAYLARHTEKIHFFRSQIPIRTARK